MGEHKGKEREGTNFIWFQVFMPAFYEFELLTTKKLWNNKCLTLLSHHLYYSKPKMKEKEIIPQTQAPA